MEVIIPPPPPTHTHTYTDSLPLSPKAKQKLEIFDHELDHELDDADVVVVMSDSRSCY